MDDILNEKLFDLLALIYHNDEFTPDELLEAIPEAKDILDKYPREMVPDWVEIIANGKPENIRDVLEIAKSDYQQEETSHD